MRTNTSQNGDGYDIYTVDHNAELLPWLLETLKKESRSKIKATLQGRGIKVNGKQVTQYNYPLKPGMKVAVSKSKKNDTFKIRSLKIVH